MENGKTTEAIMGILDKHPEGLTISSIADMIGMNRHSIVKYIYQLLGAGKIRLRKVGSAKLCYINTKGNSKLEKKSR